MLYYKNPNIFCVINERCQCLVNEEYRKYLEHKLKQWFVLFFILVLIFFLNFLFSPFKKQEIDTVIVDSVRTGVDLLGRIRAGAMRKFQSGFGEWGTGRTQ